MTSHSSNENLNYYKFGLGLGAPPPASGAKKSNNALGKAGQSTEAAGVEADAASGGADQWVTFLASSR